MHNSELADVIGNLVHRAMKLIGTYTSHVIPDTVHDPEFGLPFDAEALVNNVREDMKISSIDGFLIGGSSQKAKNFIDIIKKTIN